MRGEIAAQHVAIEALQGFRGSEQRAPHRLIRIAELVEMLEHDVVGRILRGTDLLHDHVLFPLQFLRHEGGVGEDIGEHVKRERHVGLHHPRIISRGLGRCARIEITADRLDFFHDLSRTAVRGALECHVFEQMRNAVLVRLFIAASDPGPNSERRGFDVRHGVGHHGKARIELGDFDTHPATPCFSLAARLTDLTNRSTSAWSFLAILICSGLVISPSSQVGNCGRTPQAASTASGNLAGCAVDSTMLGTAASEESRSATDSATAVWGSTSSPASRQAARISAAVSVSSARPASNASRMAASMASGSTKRPDCFSESINRRTLAASRLLASNSSRSKFEDIWMSIDGEAVACTSRTS